MSGTFTATLLQQFDGEFDPEDEDSPEGASEVVGYENGRLYVTNGNLDRIDIFELGKEGTQASIDLSFIPGYDGVQSVAVKNGLVAAAVALENTTLPDGTVVGTPGVVAFVDASTLKPIELVQVGVLPDQVSFNADGSILSVVNEGEFNADSETDIDPPGSVSIIEIDGKGDGIGIGRAKTVLFDALDGIDTAGVRIDPDVPAELDLEPEYTAFSPDGSSVFVMLQENNAVGVIDVETKTVVDLLPLGVIDHGADGNGIDPNDEDGAIDIATFADLVGLRMPDAITSFEIEGETYFATANEGDGRGDYFVEDDDGNIVGISDIGDEARVGDIIDTAGAFGAVTIDPSVDTEGLERLVVSVRDGDVDGDGDIDILNAFGSRSFSIFSDDGSPVFDSGDDFAQLIAEIAPERFQDDDGEPNENRSDNKGVEPEAIDVGEIDGDTFAFIGLERDSGIAVYNVSDPKNAVLVDYIDGFATGNTGPEVVEFVAAEDSTTGTPLLLASYEISGTTVAYELLG